MKIKFLWIDYLIFAWFIVFLVIWIAEAYYGQLNQWTLAAYLIVWGILMIIKTFIKKE